MFIIALCVLIKDHYRMLLKFDSLYMPGHCFFTVLGKICIFLFSSLMKKCLYIY